MSLEVIKSMGKELSKNELLKLKGGRGEQDPMPPGASVGCADGIEFNIRGTSDQLATELCANHGGVAYMVLLP